MKAPWVVEHREASVPDRRRRKVSSTCAERAPAEETRDYCVPDTKQRKVLTEGPEIDGGRGGLGDWARDCPLDLALMVSGGASVCLDWRRSPEGRRGGRLRPQLCISEVFPPNSSSLTDSQEITPGNKGECLYSRGHLIKPPLIVC